MTCRRHADHLEVAVYWVGVANQNEFNTLSLCMQTLDFAGEEQKTEGELENDIPENCAHSLYEQQCMHCQSLHTQSNQKSCREYSKQLTTGYTILTYPTSTRSAWSDFSRKCPLFGEKKILQANPLSVEIPLTAMLSLYKFYLCSKRLWQDLCNLFLNREVQIWAQISIIQMCILG